MKQALAKIFGDPQARTIKQLTRRVAAVNALAEKYHDMNKTDLRNKLRCSKSDSKEKYDARHRLAGRVCAGA